MKKESLRTFRKNIAAALIVIQSTMLPLTSYAGGWQQREQGWQYARQQSGQETAVKGEWLQDQDLW